MKILPVLCAVLVSQAIYAAEGTISVQDLGSKIDVIGLLGKPLGEIVEIECKGIPGPEGKTSKIPYWRDSVLVFSINGEAVKEPFIIGFAEFSTGTVSIPKPGESKKIVGYETGQFSGIPRGTFDHIPLVPGTNFGFNTSFIALQKKAN